MHMQLFYPPPLHTHPIDPTSTSTPLDLKHALSTCTFFHFLRVVLVVVWWIPISLLAMGAAGAHPGPATHSQVWDLGLSLHR